jgi:hypothetical protein
MTMVGSIGGRCHCSTFGTLYFLESLTALVSARITDHAKISAYCGIEREASFRGLPKF